MLGGLRQCKLKMNHSASSRKYKTLPPPKSWVELTDACVVRISSSGSFEAAQSELQQLVDLAPTLNSKIVQQNTRAPWNAPEVVSLFQECTFRQLVIVSDEISTFLVGLASLALESGYDTFAVIHNLDKAPQSASMRLEMIGAKIVDFERFLEECRIATNS